MWSFPETITCTYILCLFSQTLLREVACTPYFFFVVTPFVSIHFLMFEVS